MEGPNQIIFEITTEKEETQQMVFDSKILNFGIGYLSNNHHEPYPVPKNIVSSERPFALMREFVTAHQYDPSSVKVMRPIRSSKYQEVVDQVTFKICNRFCDEKTSEEAAQVIGLSRFLGFQQLTDALSAAVAVNFWIGEEEKGLQEFIRANGLEEVGSAEICEMMQVYQDQFRLLELRAKEELHKAEHQAADL